jgi:hypothetical protein
MTEQLNESDTELRDAERAVKAAEQRYGDAARKQQASDPVIKAKRELDAALDRLAVLEKARKRAITLAEEKARALALKTAAEEFRELGDDWTALGDELIKAAHALFVGARALRAAGAQAPTDAQIGTLWRGIAGILMQMPGPLAREFPVLPPNERKPIAHFLTAACSPSPHYPGRETALHLHHDRWHDWRASTR